MPGKWLIVWIAGFLGLLLFSGAMLGIAGVRFPLHGPLLLGFLLLAPAAAVSLLLTSLELLPRIVVSCAAAVVLDLLAAELALLAGAWSPRSTLAIVTGASVICALVGWSRAVQQPDGDRA